MTITIGEMREFLSYMSDDTLVHVEAAASREAAAVGATAEQRDRGYTVMYAVHCVYDDRDLAERQQRAECYW